MPRAAMNLYLCLMSSIPESLRLLLNTLKDRFHLDTILIQESTAVFRINVSPGSLIIFFYLSLRHSVLHEAKQALHERVIHIDEDLFLLRKEVIITRIGAAAGIVERVYARETILQRINKETALAFQACHHLQTALPGKYRYGLFHHGELCSIAVFSAGRKMWQEAENYRSFELLRFCHQSGYLVVGGLSKLIAGMTRHFKLNDIMTYIDRDWSNGKNYEKLGFDLLGYTPPQKFYIDTVTGQRYPAKTGTRVVQCPEAPDQHPYTTAHNLGSIKMRYTV